MTIVVFSTALKLIQTTVKISTKSLNFQNFHTTKKNTKQFILTTKLKQHKSIKIMSDVVTYLESPVKSENDKKLYKTIRLANGLQALLVSDPSPMPHDGFTTSESSEEVEGEEESSEAESGSSESSSVSESGSSSSCSASGTSCSSDSTEGDVKLSACAILVDYGSFSDPIKYQGLAHFLEHMIFMGSKKYPAENAFDAYIKKCGGMSNANTDAEETVFYFEVAEAHLDTSLDYFTALMKQPLMKQDAMQRERSSVDSEFEQIVQDDEWRRDQLLSSLATEGYPHGLFAWGNLKSLQENVNDDELHAYLHEIRKKHYIANHMYVCIQARLPIDELETLVVRHFSGIAGNTEKAIDFTKFNHRDAFRDEFSKNVFYVKAVENECKLELTWVLPPLQQFYRTNPDHFFAHLMGHEGKGSLGAYLRRRLWSLQIIAGIEDSGFDQNSIYSLFNLCIYLTDEGLKHIDEVLAATFAFVKLLEDIATLRELYKEQQQIEDVAFRFQSQRPAFDNVQDLVLNSKYYPPTDILTGKSIYYEYDESVLQIFITHLNEFKFNLMLTGKQKLDDNINYDRKEQWFNTEYSSVPMPEKWQRLWNETTASSMPELHLPEPNRFITKDFNLYWHAMGKPDVPLAPKRLLNTDTCELWYRLDDRYELPEANMYIHLISPLPRQSAKNDAMAAIYVAIVKFHISEALYPALTAGLYYELNNTDKGLLLNISGYNEKIHLLVEAIAQSMIDMPTLLDEYIFNAFVQYQRKAYFNNIIKPRILNRDVRLCLLEKIHYPMIEKFKCLGDIKLNDLVEFSKKMPQQMRIQALIQGNYTEELAHNIVNTLLARFQCSAIVERHFVEDHTVQLPQGSRFIRCHAINDQDTNTVITNFYQIGPTTVRVESILDLLMMFVEEPLFDQLRTKEQLGYHVGASVRINYGIAGYSIMVNSQETKNSANYVEERIEAFRATVLKLLRELSDEDFEHNRASLIKLKLITDMALHMEVARNWEEILNESHLFDRRRRQVEILRVLTKNDIMTFLLDNEVTNMRKLSIQVIGHRPAAAATAAAATIAGGGGGGGGGDEDADVNMETEDNEMDDVDEEGIAVDVMNDGDDDDDGDIDVNDEILSTLINNLNVSFIPKEGDATTIVDINEFKENLDVYPNTKATADASDSERDRERIAHIEDAIGNPIDNVNNGDNK